MRGTLLAQLQAEYHELFDTKEKLAISLHRNEEVLPECEVERDNAKRLLKDLEAAVNVEKKIQHCQKLIAWSQVRDAKIKRDEKITDLNNTEEMIVNLRTMKANTQALVDEVNERKAELEQLYDQRAERLQPLVDEREAYFDQKKNSDARLTRMHQDGNEANDEHKELKKQIEEAKAKIADVHREYDSEIVAYALLAYRSIFMSQV